MKQFSYIIKDEIGLHARPAGLLAKEAKKYQSTVTLSCKGKSAAASKLMAIMGMGVKHGDNVEVTIEGADEDTAAAELQKFFRENLQEKTCTTEFGRQKMEKYIGKHKEHPEAFIPFSIL